MKINLPCEIVRDLLPSYIEELTSEMSTEVVEEHLKECENCKNILGEMQKDLGPEKQAEAEERKAGFDELHRNSSSDEDKKVLLKINRKINRRLKMAILVGLLSVVLVFMTIYILYIESFKKVSVDDIAVTAKVYEIDELEIEYGTSMVTEKTGGEERSYEEKNAIIHIPGSYMSEVQISPVSLLEENVCADASIFQFAVIFHRSSSNVYIHASDSTVLMMNAVDGLAGFQNVFYRVVAWVFTSF